MIMKLFSSILLIIFISISLSRIVNAQMINDDIHSDINTTQAFELTFIPIKSARLTPVKILPIENSFLLSSLGIFNGLKFLSAIDEFSSIPMFDSRSYRPKSFSDYNNYLQKNYLILNSHSLRTW